MNISRINAIGFLGNLYIMDWFFLTIFSSFSLAFAELIQQNLLNKKNAPNERVSGVLTFIFQSLIGFILLALFGMTDQIAFLFDKTIFPKVFLVACISSIGMIFYLRSFKVKNISISTIFISFSVIVSTVLGIIFFSESVHYVKFLGIFLILFAIIFLNYQNASLEKNHIYGLLGGFFFGISAVLDKSIVLEVHPLVYLSLSFFLVAFWGFLFGMKQVLIFARSSNRIAFGWIMVSGIGYFLYNICVFFAYKYGGEVGKIDAINNLEIFLIILFEYIFLKHTQGTLRKVFSATLVIIGVYLLGIVQ